MAATAQMREGMNLFSGVHEVRLFRPNGVAVGYFDDWDAALRAVENEPSLYKAAYFTLNPLKLPEGIQVNPAALRSSAHAAGASDIERRVWLLIDCDPPRQAKTNSTAEEKQAAREEAERIREWLRSHGWPEPLLADSGNGWHLLYRIELPNDDASKTLLEKFLARLKQLFPMVDAGNFDAPRQVAGGWQIEIECPWMDEHSDENPRDTVVSFIAGRGNGFKCFHSHCSARHWQEFRAEVERRNPGLPPYFGRLPLMTHSDIARQFVEEHDDFVRVYDKENETGVWMPGTRWQIGDRGDALLRMSIRRYLDELYQRYPAPEENKRDYRLSLKQASFLSGVLSEVKPWLPPKSERDFDSHPDLLPLVNGLVSDLQAGKLRTMQREDCQTKRVQIVPADVLTPRWTPFLQEITCGDGELAAYILRVMALCITGLSLHLLIIFYGRGRNGKGVLLRLLEKILGGELFAISLRPEDVEYQRGGEERNKRLMGRLKGKRLAYTGETVSGRLDWTLLKTLTGGDTLAGAALYQKRERFKPSHTLILTTNERPVLPPTVAFKERLRFVPFLGDFSKSKDFTLEDDLAAEMPGILWQLIKAAPAVFANGDEPPATVREATDDVMDENDTARPFIEQCLIEDPNAVTPTPEMEAAVRKWIGGLVLGSVDLDRIMDGIRARWMHGRKRTPGGQIRGFIGVRLRPAS